MIGVAFFAFSSYVCLAQAQAQEKELAASPNKRKDEFSELRKFNGTVILIGTFSIGAGFSNSPAGLEQESQMQRSPSPLIGYALFVAVNLLLIAQSELQVQSELQSCPVMLHYLRTYTGVIFIDLLTSACILGHYQVVELLLILGVSPNLVLIGDEKFGGNNSLLQTAAAMGHTKVVIRLLRAGADKNYKNENGQSALDLARIHGKGGIVFLLE